MAPVFELSGLLTIEIGVVTGNKAQNAHMSSPEELTNTNRTDLAVSQLVMATLEYRFSCVHLFGFINRIDCDTQIKIQAPYQE
jgi:hypothetical protein